MGQRIEKEKNTTRELLIVEEVPSGNYWWDITDENLSRKVIIEE
jgi:hypothetical protein